MWRVWRWENVKSKEIFGVIRNYFNNKNILKNNFSAIVTAGPTREYIDPVRYLSNNQVENKVMKLLWL